MPLFLCALFGGHAYRTSPFGVEMWISHRANCMQLRDYETVGWEAETWMRYVSRWTPLDQ